jgi:hypothetical protein
MNHVDGDTLLKFVLETLDGQAEAAVRDHLSACDRCSQESGRLRAEIERMSGMEVRVGDINPPALPRRFRVLRTVSRMAAVLAVGFLLGYLTADLSNPSLPVAVQQRLIPNVVARTDTEYIPCAAIDVRIAR